MMPHLRLRTMILVLGAAGMLAGWPTGASAWQDGAPAGASDASRPAIGALVFEETTKSYGRVREGERANITYRFANKSDRPIRIVRIQTSCGCTAASGQNKVIAPGATDEIVLTYDTNGRPGPSSKTATVYTDESPDQGYVLVINGEVFQELFANPRVVAFGAVPARTEARRSVDIISISNPPAQILSIETNDPNLVIEKGAPQPYVHPDGTEGQLTTVTVTLPPTYRNPGGSFGQLNSNFTVVTTDALRPRITVPLSGSTQPPYRLTPPSLMLGRLAPGEETTATLVLAALHREAFEVRETRFERDTDRGSVTVESGATPDTRRVVVSFRAPEQATMVTSRLLVTVNSPAFGDEVIEVPIRATVRPQEGSQQANMAPAANADAGSMAGRRTASVVNRAVPAPPDTSNMTPEEAAEAMRKHEQSLQQP